jgi:hypothetical protein
MRATTRPSIAGSAHAQGGWSLPIVWILLLMVVVLYLVYGVKVLLWVGAGALGIMLLVWAYDGIARLFPSAGRFLPYGKQCLGCGATSLGQFVRHSRYLLRCTECAEVRFNASFSRAARKLGGVYEAVVVNDDLSQQRMLATGTLPRLKAEVSRESETGQWILLRPGPQ